MATQRLCGAVQRKIDSSSTRNQLQSALEEAASELTNRTKHNFVAYGPEDHLWSNPTPYYDDTDFIDDEKQYLWAFLDDVADAYDSSYINIQSGDVWMSIDAYGDNSNNGDERYGYGRSVDSFTVSTNDGYKTLWGGRALAFGSTVLVSDPNLLTRTFVKHELAHCFGCLHRHGTWYKNYHGNIYNISNMAASYVRDYAGFADTEYKGTGPTPYVDNDNLFCGGRKNQVNEYCAPGGNKCRWDFNGYTFCQEAISQIEDSAPL